MDVALGVVLILLALPGVMVSLLLFEKYGSLIRWMRGDGVFDPFIATIPDEYFFIVLSMVVTGNGSNLALGRALPRPPRLHEHHSFANLLAQNFRREFRRYSPSRGSRSLLT